MSFIGLLPISWSLSNDYRFVRVIGISHSGQIYLQHHYRPSLIFKPPEIYRDEYFLTQAPISNLITLPTGNVRAFCETKEALGATREILKQMHLTVIETHQLTVFFNDKQIVPSDWIIGKGLNATPQHQLHGEKLTSCKHEYQADDIINSKLPEKTFVEQVMLLDMFMLADDMSSLTEALQPAGRIMMIALLPLSVERQTSQVEVGKIQIITSNKGEIQLIKDFLTLLQEKRPNYIISTPGTWHRLNRRAKFLKVPLINWSSYLKYTPRVISDAFGTCCIDLIDLIRFLSPELSPDLSSIALALADHTIPELSSDELAIGGQAALTKNRTARLMAFSKIISTIGLNTISQLANFWHKDPQELTLISNRDLVRDIASFFLSELPDYPRVAYPDFGKIGTWANANLISSNQVLEHCILEENELARDFIDYFKDYPISGFQFSFLFTSGLFSFKRFRESVIHFHRESDVIDVNEHRLVLSSKSKRRLLDLDKVAELVIRQSQGTMVMYRNVQYRTGFSPLFFPLCGLIRKALEVFISDKLAGIEDPLSNDKWFDKIELTFDDYLLSATLHDDDWASVSGSYVPEILSPAKILKRTLAKRTLALGTFEDLQRYHRVKYLYTKDGVKLESEIDDRTVIDNDFYSKLLQEAFQGL